MSAAATGRRADERGWLGASAALIAFAAVARIHNAISYPPLLDFDGPGHALNVFALYQGRLPSRQLWSGFHPPVYYALGAALWRLLPEAIPVHAALRLLSALAGFGALAIAWRTLPRFTARADAAVAIALVASAPVFAIATSMLGNETACAFFATAALARLCAIPAEAPRALRHAAPTALLASLAALCKSTGLGVVAVVALSYLWKLRRDPRRARRVLLVASAVPLLLLGPFYGRLVLEGGSTLAAVRGGALRDGLGNEMAAQPPGERHLADYLAFPPAAILAPVKEAPGMLRSVPGLLYASTWADGHGQFLPARSRPVLTAAAVSALLGLVPSAIAALGAFQIVRHRRTYASAAPLLAFALLLLAAFLAQTWAVPVYSAVKASYLLPALLPAALALAVGLAGVPPGARGALRAALLAIGAFATGVTWYGWWL
jgi:hypothetical protein